MTQFGKRGTNSSNFGRRMTPSQAKAGNQRQATRNQLSPQAQAFMEAQRSAEGAPSQQKRPSNSGGLGGLSNGSQSSRTSGEGKFGDKPVAGRRMFSFMIDSAIIGIPFFVFFGSTIGSEFSAIIAAEEAGAAESVIEAQINMLVIKWFGVLALVRAIYSIGMESSALQATLGKMALGLVVTGKDKAKPSLTAIILRNTIGRLICNIVPFYIGYIMGFFNENKKMLHDMIGGSMVCTKTNQLSAVGVSEVFA